MVPAGLGPYEAQKPNDETERKGGRRRVREFFKLVLTCLFFTDPEDLHFKLG